MTTPRNGGCLHLHSIEARDLNGRYELCLHCGADFIFPPKPFVASFSGDLYEPDPATWEMWLRTGELKYLRKVEKEEERKTA